MARALTKNDIGTEEVTEEVLYKNKGYIVTNLVRDVNGVKWGKDECLALKDGGSLYPLKLFQQFLENTDRGDRSDGSRKLTAMFNNTGPVQYSLRMIS